MLFFDINYDMNIRDKLARLDSVPVSPEPELPAEDVWIEQLQRELGIQVLRDARSFVLLKENSFPVYNDPLFDDLRARGFAMPSLQRISSDLPPGLDNLRRAVFIDTETTGLAGGAGTYAFLIGIGHLELDHMVVRQYLLPDFGHEWLMLNALEQALGGFAYTVSFNGKSFDIPLLKNRYVLNQMITSLEDMPHLDLLHAARRIWRRRLPACDLQSLERYILNITRDNDLPGELVPQAYFEFIRKREALLLRDVLEHNYYDIVHMALLTFKIAAVCEAPLAHLTHPPDIFSLAKYDYQNGRFSDTLPLLEQLLNSPEAHRNEWYRESACLLSMAYKRLGDPERARDHLQELLDRNLLQPDIIEALAKHYEHHTHDYQAAREVVERGMRYLEMLRQLDSRSPWLRYLPRLRHRHQRLLRKLGE